MPGLANAVVIGDFAVNRGARGAAGKMQYHAFGVMRTRPGADDANAAVALAGPQRKHPPAVAEAGGSLHDGAIFRQRTGGARPERGFADLRWGEGR
jgi:hypothetical protein